jgi:hypothetical protein
MIQLLLLIIIAYAVKTYIDDEKDITPKTTPVEYIVQDEKTFSSPDGSTTNTLKCKNGFINNVNARTGNRIDLLNVSCSDGETFQPVGNITGGAARDPLIIPDGFNKITIQRNPNIMNSFIISDDLKLEGQNHEAYKDRITFDLQCKDISQKIIGIDVLERDGLLVGVYAIYCKNV